MTPGIYPQMPMDEYLKLQAVSSGLCHRILSQSPLHAWIDSPWNPARKSDDNGTADIGSYAHACLLEGGTKALFQVDAPDWRTKDARQQRDDARAMGLLPILVHKVDEVEAMVKAAKSFINTSELLGLFDEGAAEQTIVFEQRGLLCKARPDWLTEDRKICLSYKTTAGSAQPDAWIRTQLPGYDIGIVFYEAAVKYLGGSNDTAVITLVQEQKEPYSCSLIGLSPAWKELANARMRSTLSVWGACMNTGDFSAYPSRICWAEPKGWMLAEQEEKDVEDHSFADPSKLWGKP